MGSAKVANGGGYPEDRLVEHTISLPFLKPGHTPFPPPSLEPVTKSQEVQWKTT